MVNCPAMSLAERTSRIYVPKLEKVSACWMMLCALELATSRTDRVVGI